MTIGSIVGVGAALVGTLFFMGVGNKHSTFTINNTSDFINFANNVNSGTSYLGTTVLLNSDIDFSGGLSKQFEPIGKDSPNYFQGTFDGQGHIISNLKINSASRYVGLFGFSEGLTIKNVVLDDSCSITSSYSDSDDSYAGGIIGQCWSKKGVCITENSINMANIAFNGNIKSDDLYIGGIAGFLSSYSSSNSITVKNCANYGSITYLGKSGRSHIGGIVGAFWGAPRYKYIHNCVNYGKIAHSETTSKELYVGGIIGYSYYTYVENCLSAGKISYVNTPSTTHIGSITGYVNNETYINYCFWTSDVGVKKIYGNGKPKITETSTSSTTASYAVNKLNARVSSNSGNNWNRWLYNPKNEAIKFTINDNKYFFIESQAILLPDIASNGTFSFSGWYTDPGYSKPFTDNTITSNKELYGIYNKKVVVKFYSNKWNILRKPAKEVTLGGAYGELPKPTKKGYTFAGWYTDKDGNTKIEPNTKVKTENYHTLYVRWTPNEYIVTLNPNGGNTLFNPKKTVIYDNYYGDLETPTRTGYAFNGWYINNYGNTKIEPDTKVDTANDHTLYARWTPNKYTVTFDVNGGDNPLFDKTREVTYDAPYRDLPLLERDGYKFSGWFNEKDGGDKIKSSTTVIIPRDHNIYAHWTSIKHTVTFDANGGDPLPVKSIEVALGSTYGDLETPKRTGYAFDGWFTDRIGGDKVESTTKVATASDHTLYAHWAVDSFKWVYITLICVFVFGVIILIAFTGLKKYSSLKTNRKSNDINSEKDSPFDDDTNSSKNGITTHSVVCTRIVGLNKNDIATRYSSESVSILSKLYEKEYKRPTMRDALKDAQLPDDKVDKIIVACENCARAAADEGKLFEGFTIEDAAAIAMYTYDFGKNDYENNPYRIINKSLAERDYDRLQNARDILYLVMTALRKLPRTPKKTLYRGVKGMMNLDEDHYCVGNTITWPALSSTSSDMKQTEEFLTRGSKNGKATGTLFIIEDGWGYDIQPYSLFPDEAEILIEPERQFEVTGVESDGLTKISLKMLDTPLSIPEIFGEGQK